MRQGRAFHPIHARVTAIAAVTPGKTPGRHRITIDLLGGEFLEAVSTGDPIAIHEDGTVEVG
jgi:hypothetical protein